jgi:hypothetical protein
MNSQPANSASSTPKLIAYKEMSLPILWAIIKIALSLGDIEAALAIGTTALAIALPRPRSWKAFC